MADKWQGEATRSIRSWGFGTYKAPDLRFGAGGQMRFQDTPGMPDLFVYRGGRMCFVEIKDAYTNFPFANFETTKRDYIRDFCKKPPYQIEVWLWMCLGSGAPTYKPEKLPRKSWLLPIDVWYSVENKIKPYQSSLPYRVGKGYNIHMQQNKLDAVTLLEKFELQWKGAGVWGILPVHPFFQMYVVPEPIPLYRSEENKREQRSSAIATPNPQRNHGSRRYQYNGIRGNDAGYGLARESLLYPRSDASIGNFERQDHTSHALLRLAGVV